MEDTALATPLNIKDPEAYELASDIAQTTGKSLTRVVIDALRREKQMLRTAPEPIDMAKVRAILAELHAMPEVDSRSPDEILNDLYDQNGLPR